MKLWLIRLYRRDEGKAEPVLLATYVVGVPDEAVAKDLAKGYSFIRYGPSWLPAARRSATGGHCGGKSWPPRVGPGYG